MYFKRKEKTSENATAGVNTKKAVTMDIMTAHRKLNHMNEDQVRQTCRHLGWELKRGTLAPCDASAAGKAKQKAVPKESDHVPSTKPGERVYLDLSLLKGDDKV